MLKVVSSYVNVIGALNYKGTWNASTNTPALASGVGTKGDYYVVSVAGTTALDGETLWGVGDWAVFNGATWQKVDGGDTGNYTNVTSGFYVANGAIGGALTQGAYSYGTMTFADTNQLATYQNSVNSFNQFSVQNSNNGATASTGVLVSNDVGTATTFYGEFGMNSSGFTGSGAFNAPSAVYLTSTSGDLAIGTTTANNIRFVVNSGATDSMTIASTGTTIATAITSPIHYGGTAAGSTLTLQSTSGAGTTDAIVMKVGNAGAVTALYANSTGQVGIGSTPYAKFSVYDATASQAIINGDSTTAAIVARSSTDATGPNIALRKNRGTTATPTAVASADNIGNVNFNAYGGTNLRTLTQIYSNVDTFTSDSNISSYLVLATSPSGSAAAVESVRLDQAGSLTIRRATGSLGYGTGSGGAVTQITSRTTGVTLNNPTGAITLVSAAGSATYQSFTVTNSTVAATDTIVVNQKSGTDKYIILVTAVAAGSFQITFATTGGTTTEQPVFNFAVIKGVTA